MFYRIEYGRVRERIRLLAEGKAIAIEEIDSFVSMITKSAHNTINDTPFIAYCRTMPTYEEVMTQFPE